MTMTAPEERFYADGHYVYYRAFIGPIQIASTSTAWAREIATALNQLPYDERSENGRR